MGTVHIRRGTLTSPDAARLIAALNSELTTTFPQPGATHFSLSDAQVVAATAQCGGDRPLNRRLRQAHLSLNRRRRFCYVPRNTAAVCQWLTRQTHATP